MKTIRVTKRKKKSLWLSEKKSRIEWPNKLSWIGTTNGERETRVKELKSGYRN